MSFRKFQMHQYLYVICPGWVTQTAPSPDPNSWGEKIVQFGHLALKNHWLAPETPLHDQAAIACAMEALNPSSWSRQISLLK